MTTVQLPQICFDDVRGEHLLIALSGGADSVALTCLLAQSREEYALRLTAAHLNHGIRGADADADAALCRALCDRLGIPLIEGRADVPRLAHESNQGLEAAARDARYRFLRETRARCGADRIALAHHLDDQAETVLMHLLRGTGPEGICGMARISGELYRPLLELRKAALVQFLEGAGISWREDATNAVADNPRNALRLNVLPEIEKSYPSAAESIARYARIARIESDCLARQTDSFLAERVERGPWGWRIASGPAEEAVLRRCIRRICGANLPAQRLDEAVALWKLPRRRTELGGGWTAERTNGALYLMHASARAPAEVLLNPNGTTVLPGVCRVCVELGDFPIEPDNPLVEVVDAEALSGAVLRTRRDGDRIHPLGAPGSRLLSDYLTDRRIDRPLRDFLPLIAREGRILWVGGAIIAEEARVTASTRTRARITLFPITDENPEVCK